MSQLLNFILEHEEQFRRARLPSLYSDFRHQRTTNPDGYAVNISAWRTALQHAAREGLIPAPGATNDLLVLNTGHELLLAVETKEWGQPLALGTVIKEAVVRKEMIPLVDFLTATESIYNKSWIITPWQVITWGLRQLGLAGGLPGEDKLSVGRFVILANVEEAAKKIVRSVSGRVNRVDRVFSKEMFMSEFAKSLNEKFDLTDTDFDVLLTFLARDKRELAFDGKTVKFKLRNELTITITTQDKTIASLKSLIADLTTQVSILTSRIDTLSVRARDAVSSKNRVVALTSLRSKKLAETNLTQRSEMLAQLEQVYSKIEQAADQVEIVRVMEASTGVLKGLHGEAGGVERVEVVVEELREEMSKVDEVGQIISEATDPIAAVDEVEVDDELEAMEREDRDRREAAEAEETRQRLAAIKQDTAGGANVPPEPEIEQQRNADSEKQIEESIAQLGRMSLEEPPKASKDEVVNSAVPAS